MTETITGLSSHRSFRLFSAQFRTAWFVAVAVTILSEILPQTQTAPAALFYLYMACKALCFVLVGYLAPLSFWQFNALNRGVLYAVLSAAGVEILQGLIGHGHSFHWHELAVKLVLLLLGFILALDARYERAICFGPFFAALEWPDHVPQPGHSRRA